MAQLLGVLPNLQGNRHLEDAAAASFTVKIGKSIVRADLPNL